MLDMLLSCLLYKTVNMKMPEAVIFPVVLHGFEISSVTLEEEHRMSVFENRVLRRMFGHKRDEVKGG
jgi:hypothetical protein